MIELEDKTMSKQSSVDFYRIESQKLMVKAIRNEISNDEWRLLENELGNQAKAMHKEEIGDAYRISPNNEIWSNSGIDYYNETFGGNNE